MSMDVLGILRDQREELLDIDLDCLEDELLQGGYDQRYVRQCHDLIDGIRRQRAGEGLSIEAAPKAPEGVEAEGDVGSSRGADSTGGTGASGKPTGGSVFVPSESLSPFGSPAQGKALTPEEVVARDLAVLRRSDNGEKEFAEYLAKSTVVDEAFVDRHIDLFDEAELRTIVRSMRLSEAFLEKYFDVLDHKAISEHQRFSEEFFIRHYADLDATSVLRRGPNEWRRKDRRSPKLDVFLRLKGVRI